MGNPNQVVDESPAAESDETPSGSVIQSAVDAALAEFAAANGLEVPKRTTQAPSALQALGQLEDTTFGEKVLALVHEGVGEAALVEESPVVRALAAVVGEIASKVIAA
jgi:hypothetical protein